MKNTDSFKYDIVGLNEIFDEKGNTFLALREITWGDSENVKLDMRKWYSSKDGNETLGKGFSFLTEQGPHELTRILLSNGYCETKDVLESIKDRDDFISSLATVIGKDALNDLGVDTSDVKTEDEEYYDPKELLA